MLNTPKHMGDNSQNHILLKKIADGDEAALEEIISSNLGLVKSIALRFRDRGVEYEDLVQIGTIGMIKAARSFDFSYDTVFSTYAVPLIIGEIKRFLRDDGPIKISRNIKRQSIHIMKMKEELTKILEREPRISELAEYCEISEEELVRALEAATPITSLSEPVGESSGGDGVALGELLPDTSSTLDMLTDKIALNEAITGLDDCQRQIIYLRYYRDMSQQQTGAVLGLSQVKVSREEKKIIQLLREAL